MSKEFIEAEMALFMEQAKDVDIIITTVGLGAFSSNRKTYDCTRHSFPESQHQS